MNRAKKKYVSARCSICGKVFLMGFNGNADGCDKCTNTTRNTKGYISKTFGKPWSPIRAG